MQITRIKQIKDYRIFQNWRQRGNTDFARFNVIYGGNGSGKSTLAALLTEVAKGDWSDGTILTVNKLGKSGNQTKRSQYDSAYSTRITSQRILNSIKVKRSHCSISAKRVSTSKISAKC